LEASGITLNKSKCEFYRKGLTFFGMNFSEDGISPTHDRGEALRAAKQPRNAKELRSLLGMVSYSGRFIKNLTNMTAPLWRLTRPKTEWQWGPAEQKAFESLKEDILTKCLAYFNKEWHTEVIVDAGPEGLGAVLVQINPSDKLDRKVVCFASRLLTDVERRYSQCEKEGIAAVWGCERYWMYLFGKPFVLVTDNRAIQLIFGHAAARPPARIERWGLRLSQFDYVIQHQPGAYNIADYLSRHPHELPSSAVENEGGGIETEINFVVERALPPAITRAQVASQTSVDIELNLLRKYIQSNQDQLIPAGLAKYKQFMSEIS
jgi:hypothetical protein